MPTSGPPAAAYKFNNLQEIKSHSAVLFNERMAILFYIMDMKTIEMQTSYDIGAMLHVRSIMKQIFVYVRTLVRNNPTMRASLNLDTKDPGVYTVDVAFGMIDNMIEYCEQWGYTIKKLYIIIQNIYNTQRLLIDILQYHHYFIRPDFRQKPDIEMATERYKEIADTKTLAELAEIVGKKHHIDFEGLGTSRVEMQQSNEPEETEEEYLLEDKNTTEEDDDGTPITTDGFGIV